ncbi:KPN_02809 family neutral zinc metallopeptidase [Oryzihumus sp.]|uniref:KPN_02809 family neutral zinc metallopeptidase n=1 Tax=Oryzihumus sp. TaxID=1968903 RepID=UPI002EDA2285
MSFNDDAGLDTSQVESGGGGGFPGGGLVVGGGAGGILLLILALVFGPGVLGGQDPSTAGSAGGAGGTGTGQSEIAQRCRTGADANANVECRVVGTVNSVQSYWATALPRFFGTNYTRATTRLYSGAVPSACGTASNQVGPFYCPRDGKAYIDASFFSELTSRFGADSGALAQEYVVAHEYGHHVQDLLGVLDAAQQDPQGPESGSVRIELMADCFAGAWAHDASTTTDAQGNTYLKPLTQNDIRSALSAASAVGDDRIQQKAQGRVTPESWTHGSSAERQKWFLTGYRSGDPRQCDTLHATSLN